MSATEQTLATLFTRQHGNLVRRLRRLGAPPWRAEDLVQEAYLRLLARPAELNEPQAYLYRVARNLLIDAARQEQRRSEVLAAAPEDLDAASEVSDGETCMLDREATEQLHSALADLPDEARQALASRLSGLTFAQIAQVSHVTVKTAFDRTGRAVAQLHADLEENRPPDRHWRSRLPGRCPMSNPHE